MQREDCGDDNTRYISLEDRDRSTSTKCGESCNDSSMDVTGTTSSFASVPAKGVRIVSDANTRTCGDLFTCLKGELVDFMTIGGLHF